MKRKLLLIAGLSLVPIAFGVVWLFLPTDPINVVNYERIEVGMTEAEVAQILGDHDFDTKNSSPPQRGFEESLYVKGWSRPGPDTILVYFQYQDGQWIVLQKRCYFPTFWERVKNRWNGKRLEEPA